MKNDRSRRRPLTLGATAAVILVLAWQLSQGEPSLLSAATVRCPLHGKSFVAWVSTTEAVMIQSENPAASGGPPILHPYVVNVRTGEETALTDLDAWWREERLKASDMVGAFGSLSPDGKSLLIRCDFRPMKSTIRSRLPQTGYYRHCVLDARSRSVHVLPIDSQFQVAYWRPDSQSALAIQPGWKPQGYPLDPAEWTVRSFPIDPHGKSGNPRKWTVSDAHEIPLGYAGDGRFLTALNLGPREAEAVGAGQASYKFSPEFRLIEYAGDAHLKEASRCSVPYPPGFMLSYPVVSGASRRILWHAFPEFRAETPYWLQQVKERLAALMPGGSGQRLSLWSSDVEGRSMCEIGYVAYSDVQDLIAARWLPDERHVSFEYRGMLYVVSVP